MDASLETRFLQSYKEYRESAEYRGRRQQTKFCAVARSIINAALRSDLTNEALTAFIHLFKPRDMSDKLVKYLVQIGVGKEEQLTIQRLYSESGVAGYTAVGKSAIQGLDLSQLKAVNTLLESARDAQSVEDVLRAVSKYERQGVPQVKMGIYSPWLYYLQPEMCPIVNGAIKSALRLFGWDQTYMHAVKLFQRLKQLTHETDLGMIDFYFPNYRYRNN